jgi:hypothetical protein
MTSRKAELMGLRYTGDSCHYSNKKERFELKEKAKEYRINGKKAYIVDDNSSYVYIYSN